MRRTCRSCTPEFVVIVNLQLQQRKSLQYKLLQLQR